MVPTLYPNDLVIFIKANIKVNSIIIINDPLRGEIIKRVKGLPGDYIVDSGFTVKLHILKRREVDQVDSNMVLNTKVQIPNGFYYVMGDNSMKSYDSRHFGLVCKDQIKGVMLFKISR
jgi:signal peptidase I